MPRCLVQQKTPGDFQLLCLAQALADHRQDKLLFIFQVIVLCHP